MGYVTEERGILNNFAVEPTMYVDEESGFGFTERAEKLNGRLAMMGFIAAIALELLTGHGVIGFLSNL